MNGGELLVLLVVVMLVLGPERLPEYAAKLRELVRQGRDLARGVQQQLKEEAGDPLGGVDWKAYDPRQYDPRRIVREVLAEETAAPVVAAAQKGQPFDPDRPVPFDREAT